MTTMKDFGVRVFRKQMLVGTGFTGDERKMFEVRIEIDIDRIMRGMAPKARRNKSKRSRFADGAIVCRLEDIPQTDAA